MATTHETEHAGGGHPFLKQYIFIAILLFAITIVEFVIIKDFPGEAEKVIADALGQPSTTILLFLLSGIKFAIVILFYMHLKFDNKFFFWVFIAGMVLAVMVGLALIGLFTAVKPTLGGEPRLPDVAAPCAFDHELGKHGENVCPDPTPQPTSTPAPTLEALASPCRSSLPPVEAVRGDGEPTAAEGERLANEVYGCNACHSTDGTVLVGTVVAGHLRQPGSDWKGGGSATVDDDYIRESIHTPDANWWKDSATLMPVLGLSDAEIDSIIEYIKTLN